MNGSSTRIFQNVRYDLVLNDDNPNDYYFEPTGPKMSRVRAMERLKKKREKKKNRLQLITKALEDAGDDETKAKEIFLKGIEDKKIKINRKKETPDKVWEETKETYEKKKAADYNKQIKKDLKDENKAQGKNISQKIGKGITSIKKGVKAVGKSVKDAPGKAITETFYTAKDQKSITYKDDLDDFEIMLTQKKYPSPAKAKQQMTKLLKRGRLGSDPSMKWSNIKEKIKDMDAKELKNYLSRETSFLAKKGRQAKATGSAGDKAVKGLFSGTYNAVKGAGKAANEITKQGSLGVVRQGVGAAGSKAFKGGKAIGKYAKGITTAQNNYNNVNKKSKHVTDLERIEEYDKKKLREKVKEIKMLEKIIFKLSGQPTATRKRLNKIGKGAVKGLKFAGKGLFKLGKKGVGFLNKIPGSKVGFGSSMRSMGKGFKMGSKGARAGIKRLKTFGGFASKGAGAGIRRLKTIGGGGAKLALKGVKAAGKAAAATAAAIAAKTKTPVNDEPGLVCWSCTNLPPCLILKIFAPVLCCTFLTEEKAKEQAKRLKN